MRKHQSCPPWPAGGAPHGPMTGSWCREAGRRGFDLSVLQGTLGLLVITQTRHVFVIFSFSVTSFERKAEIFINPF